MYAIHAGVIREKNGVTTAAYTVGTHQPGNEHLRGYTATVQTREGGDNPHLAAVTLSFGRGKSRVMLAKGAKVEQTRVPTFIIDRVREHEAERVAAAAEPVPAEDPADEAELARLADEAAEAAHTAAAAEPVEDQDPEG